MNGWPINAHDRQSARTHMKDHRRVIVPSFSMCSEQRNAALAVAAWPPDWFGLSRSAAEHIEALRNADSAAVSLSVQFLSHGLVSRGE